jgi:hypothetical protein
MDDSLARSVVSLLGGDEKKGGVFSQCQMEAATSMGERMRRRNNWREGANRVSNSTGTYHRSRGIDGSKKTKQACWGAMGSGM